jgi:hypothetical protein
MTKVYRATTQFTLPVLLEGKVKYVVFSEENYSASVPDEKTQKAIEASSYFRSGKIKLFTQRNDGTVQAKKAAPGFEEREFPEVSNIQEAVEILKGEPYKVANQSLRTPENVMKQAEANRVKFPNLKNEKL